jgi:hypothetical protein
MALAPWLKAVTYSHSKMRMPQEGCHTTICPLGEMLWLNGCPWFELREVVNAMAEQIYDCVV